MKWFPDNACNDGATYRQFAEICKSWFEKQRKHGSCLNIFWFGLCLCDNLEVEVVLAYCSEILIQLIDQRDTSRNVKFDNAFVGNLIEMFDKRT